MSELKDMKEALSSARKADTTHVRRSFQIYTARPCEYGSEKYERANFMRRLGKGSDPTRADFERFRSYLRAARDHIDDALESMERHQSQDPKLEDVEGMKRAAYAVDTDAKPGQKIGASMLPHVAPACASLMMAITQATDCGLLPKDPGTPWRTAPAVAAYPLEFEDPGPVSDGIPGSKDRAPIEVAPTAAIRKGALQTAPVGLDAILSVTELDREISEGFGVSK